MIKQSGFLYKHHATSFQCSLTWWFILVKVHLVLCYIVREKYSETVQEISC